MLTLEELRSVYADIMEKLMKPQGISSVERAQLTTRQVTLRKILDLADRVERLRETLAEYQQASNDDDADLRALAKEELPNTERTLADAEAQLRRALLPRDPHAGKDVMMEIRAGAGGDEASLFARELLTAYQRFAERKGWKAHIVSESRTDLDGYKEVIVEISGPDVYGALRWESGVHRIQRIPATEKMGRIHTSTVTVVVLPKASEVEVVIRPEDLRIDTFRAGGHGGQHVQKTDSAVRITHLPTGFVTQCQDERSQQRNRERALSVLRARLFAHMIEQQERAQGVARRAQIGTGDRSEKIRTYNIPQDRMTDHRIKKSWHGVAHVLDGDFEEITTCLTRAYEDLQLGAT